MYILLHVLKTLSLEMNSNKPPAILTHLDILGIKKKLLQLGGGDNFIMGHWEGVGAFFFFFTLLSFILPPFRTPATNNLPQNEMSEELILIRIIQVNKIKYWNFFFFFLIKLHLWYHLKNKKI